LWPIRSTCRALQHGRPTANRSPRRRSITASHTSSACRSTVAPPAIFVQEYSVDPAWAPDGRFVVYSGPDIGTTFSLKAVTAEGAAHPLPALTLTRGAQHLTFLPGGRALVLLRGEIQHKNLWLIDLETGAERQLTNLNPDFDIRDFDVSPDGREVVLERVQERSDVVLLDLPRP
jgi:Tol biopolymer transport system component